MPPAAVTSTQWLALINRKGGNGEISLDKTNRAAGCSALWRKHPVLYPDCIIQLQTQPLILCAVEISLLHRK